MRSLTRFPSSFTISQKVLHYLSSTHFAASFSSSSGDGIIPESVAYRRSMLRPPSAVALWNTRRNDCSFIGTMVGRVHSSGGSRHGPHAFAFLEVKSDHRLLNSSYFRVCLWMQGKLAEISVQHLKLNDFIYVSGSLGSYEKLNASGQPEIFYKVYVQELNYVRQLDQRSSTETLVNQEAGELFASHSDTLVEEMAGASGQIPEKQHLNRLHLWQLFFASPNEWWDNRRTKKNPTFPDFKHKDTRECLWLSPDDPPWVRRQLELYDSCFGGGFKRDANVLLDSYKWKFKGF